MVGRPGAGRRDGLAAPEVGYRARVGQQGGQVAGDEGLALAVANDQPAGVAQPERDQLPRLQPAGGHDGGGAPDAPRRQPDRLLQR